MDDATRALLDLWEIADETVGSLATGDFARPLARGHADGLGDVADLAVHLSGVHYAGPQRLREAVSAARARAGADLAARPPSERVLGAQCLDMCLHTHDLTTAFGASLDLTAHGAATREAARMLLGLAPRLLVAAVGPQEAALRVEVRDPVGADPLTRAVRVAGGATRPEAPRLRLAGAADGLLVIDADAFVLLMAGRADAEELRARGAAQWEGAAAEAFVGRGRLLPQAKAG